MYPCKFFQALTGVFFNFLFMEDNTKNIYQPEFIPFYVKEVEYLRLTPTEGLAYGFIKFYAKNNPFFFSSEHFSEIIWTTKWTVDNIVNKLKKIWVIKVETNRYNHMWQIKSNRKITFIWLSSLNNENILFSLHDENTISSYNEDTISSPDEVKENNKNNNKENNSFPDFSNKKSEECLKQNKKERLEKETEEEQQKLLNDIINSYSYVTWQKARITPTLIEELKKLRKKLHLTETSVFREEWNISIRNYQKDILSRKQDSWSYYDHRFSLRDFLKRDGGFIKFNNL